MFFIRIWYYYCIVTGFERLRDVSLWLNSVTFLGELNGMSDNLTFFLRWRGFIMIPFNYRLYKCLKAEDGDPIDVPLLDFRGHSVNEVCTGGPRVD